MTRAKFRILVSTATNSHVEVSYHDSSLGRIIPIARRYKQTPTVQKIAVGDEFEEIWWWTPEHGEEKNMSRFATLMQESRGNWVNATAKKLLASHKIPFTVTRVSDMTWNKNFRVDEWNLQILFTPGQVAEYPELKEEMTLTLSSVPKAGREESIKALKLDTDEGNYVDNVILTYDASIGRNGWYDLDILTTQAVAV